MSTEPPINPQSSVSDSSPSSESEPNPDQSTERSATSDINPPSSVPDSPPNSESEPNPDQSTERPAAPDEHLVEQTKQQIRGLVREIAKLAKSDVSTTDFYEGFLGRVISALAAEGGALWMIDDEQRLQLQYQINLQATGLAEDQQRQLRHGRLLQKVCEGGQPTLIAPHSGPADDDSAANPTEYLLLFGVVKIDQQIQGIVEVFQRPEGGPATQRGYLRFLVEMCELVGNYLKSSRLRHFTDRQSLWEQLEKFIAQIHRSLDPRLAAFTIANEGRRLIQSDRVSVALPLGKKFRIAAVSGMDNINQRAAMVTNLNQLATDVVKTREPIWYTGSCDDLPPQIERSLQTYVDQSHAKMVAVLPLTGPGEESGEDHRKDPSQVIGALVVENFDDSRAESSLRHRVEVVASHSGSALANAHEYQSLFLMPLWRALGKASWVVRARTLPKTIAISATILAVILALVLVRTDFELDGRGELQPQLRRNIFSPLDGVIAEVSVDHGAVVQKDQQLLRMRSTDVEVDLEKLIGDRTSTNEQALSIQRMLLGQNRLSADEQNRLSGQLLGLRKSLDSLDTQIELLRRKEELLIVQSPINGQVVTWQAHENLIHRPVRTGDRLMTVVDPNGEWELEIMMPEKDMGHVAQAWKKSQHDGTDLDVTFILATHPAKKYLGNVREIHRTADVHGDGGNTVLVRVQIKSELPELLPGVTVTAKIHCGIRPIGYVWLHDLIAFMQAKVLFWL